MGPETVVVERTPTAQYPRAAPFHPAERYPECTLPAAAGPEPNEAYDAVRCALRRAGLDAQRYGSPDWNPLREFIRPGQFVLLKPNLVKESHPRDPQGWRYTITHGSVIRAVADYVWKALDGRGRVALGDAPQTDSDFGAMVRLLGLDAIRDFYREHGLDLELIDFRKEQWINVDEVIVERRRLAGDPNGYVAFDLGARSEFVSHGGEGRYYGADYDDGEVNRHHRGGRHEYLITGAAVACDVFINLPKLKTHKKAGITVNLKNLVGINGDKNWLPHHTVGTPEDGGDQFPSRTLKRSLEHRSAQLLRRVALRLPGVGPWLLRKARAAGKGVFGDTPRTIRSGNWHGNDTTWRMCLDLNKLLLYGNADGSLRSAEPGARKTYLCFVDGILGGDHDGPMNPDPIESRVLLFGRDPACTDAAAAVLMGFDPRRIPIVANAFRCRGLALTPVGDWGEVRCLSNVEAWSGRLASIFEAGDVLRFHPHFGWVGQIEAPRAPGPGVGSPSPSAP